MAPNRPGDRARSRPPGHTQIQLLRIVRASRPLNRQHTHLFSEQYVGMVVVRRCSDGSILRLEEMHMTMVSIRQSELRLLFVFRVEFSDTQIPRMVHVSSLFHRRPCFSNIASSFEECPSGTHAASGGRVCPRSSQISLTASTASL